MTDVESRPYEVFEYSIDQLISLMAKYSKNEKAVVVKKLHKHYFDSYFEHLRAKTIVVERNYIDRDYIEDYSSYYVRCFNPYEKICTRFHFFNSSFTEELFNDYITQPQLKTKIIEPYLGFVVIKPLPETVVGRTCLRTYDVEGRRNFPIVRTYNPNLFGIELSVETLAFQEQDGVAAACATSALWSVFQGTGKIFQHPILSPVEITKAASERMPIESRILPNRGLTVEMMAHAIRHVGLEPIMENVEDIPYLKSTLYAYLRGRIPMILGVELFDTSMTPNESMGFHAVAVTGYSLGEDKSAKFDDSNLLLEASRIDKLYVHDDQVGPFSRIIDDGIEIEDEDGETRPSFYSSWIGEDKKIGSVRMVPVVLLIPLYHKIRIPFCNVQELVDTFNDYYNVFNNKYPTFNDDLEWDIYLTTNTELKIEIREFKGISKENKAVVLVRPMPRYIWRATALYGGNRVFDFIFDATDIEQGLFFLGAIEYDKLFSEFIRTHLLHDIDDHVTDGCWQILKWYEKH